MNKVITHNQMDLRWEFRAHDQFHRAVANMVMVGGLAGLGVYVAHLAIPAFGPISGVLAFVAVSMAVGFAALPQAAAGLLAAGLRFAVGALMAVAAGAIMEPILGPILDAADAASWPGLGGVAIAAVLAFTWYRGLHGRRLWVAVLLGAMVLLLARFVMARFAYAEVLSAAPGWLAAGISGLAFAAVAALALLPRHLYVVRDRVREAWGRHQRHTSAPLPAEVEDLIQRALSAWDSLHRGPDDQLSANERLAVESSLMRLVTVASNWHNIDGADAGKHEARTRALAVRITAMDDKLASCSDEEAMGQYREARAALDEQMRHLRDIATSRERLVARLHHYVAAIERLACAAASSRSADASRQAGQAQPLIEEIDALGRDLEIGRQSWDELELGRGIGSSPMP